jgi:hypothetical protein
LIVALTFAIGQMSADQHEQINILRGATSFNMVSAFVRQNGNFEKSQELKKANQKN